MRQTQGECHTHTTKVVRYASPDLCATRIPLKIRHPVPVPKQFAGKVAHFRVANIVYRYYSRAIARSCYCYCCAAAFCLNEDMGFIVCNKVAAQQHTAVPLPQQFSVSVAYRTCKPVCASKRQQNFVVSL